MKYIPKRAWKVALPMLAMAAMVLLLMWMAGSFHQRLAPIDKETGQASVDSKDRFEEVQAVDDIYIETVIGTVVAERKTTVSAKYLATIQSIHVKPADQVKKGDLLVELDDRSLKAQQQQADEKLRAAQAVLANAQADFRRYERLKRENVASQSELDQALAQYQIAQAGVAAARQQVHEAQVGTSYSKIYSPIDGRVVERLAEPGDVASPATPILTLYDSSSLRLEAPVREALATQLRVGEPLQVRIEALDLDVQGQIDEIVPQAQSQSRSFLVKIAFQPNDSLYAGMFGRVMIPAGKRIRVCIPERAIQRIGQLEFTYVLRPDQSLEKRFIQTGEHGEQGKVEVLSGLEPGEKVLITIR